jgi:octaprenyl-diphosphate synthase
MSIQQIKELVAGDLKSMGDLITNRVKNECSLIDDLSNHIIQSGGKKLRPLIVLLSSYACGYTGNEHINMAAMIECFHTATLLHDDVVDESKLRRGKQTANTIWGSKASILVGDYLFTLYIEFMQSIGNTKIMKLLSQVTHKITCGEIQQLVNCNNYNITIKDYFDVISFKTSILFAASAAIGAMICNKDSIIENGLYNYGLHLGNAFQLIDDSLDYCSDAKTLGKNIGDDLSQGKATLPLIYVLQNGSQTQKEVIKKSLEANTNANLTDVLNILTETKAIEYTNQIALEEVDKAISSLHILPESIYKKALQDIAVYAVERTY